MAHPVHDQPGGIRSLISELKSHGEAITHDLVSAGWSRSDIGRGLSWTEFYHWLKWLPPTPETAYFRARKPNSWWVTPELQLLAGVLYAGEAANWQRGGCQGNAPKPVKFPQDRDETVRDADELAARKNAIRRRRET